MDCNTLISHIKKLQQNAENRFQIRAYDIVKNQLENEFSPNDKLRANDLTRINLTEHMKQKLVKIINNKSGTNKSGTNKSSTNKSSTNKSGTNKSSTNKSSTNKSSTNKSSTNKSSTNKSGTNKSDTNKSSTNKSSTNKSSTNKSDTNKYIDADLLASLQNLSGIGAQKARELVKNGIESIEQLNKPEWFNKLPIETQTFLRNKPVDRIPHEFIQTIEPKLQSMVDNIIKHVEIVGSYRRKKRYSSDVDVQVVCNKKDQEKCLSHVLEKIKTMFKVQEYSQGPAKLSFIVKDSIVFKMDIFCSTVEEAAANLLYSTGSKQFNIRMRALAKRKGYLLNQHGLFKINSSSTTNGGEKKIKIPIRSEYGYFTALGMNWVEPQNRE